MVSLPPRLLAVVEMGRPALAGFRTPKRTREAAAAGVTGATAPRSCAALTIIPALCGDGMNKPCPRADAEAANEALRPDETGWYSPAQAG